MFELCYDVGKLQDVKKNVCFISPTVARYFLISLSARAYNRLIYYYGLLQFHCHSLPVPHNTDNDEHVAEHRHNDDDQQHSNPQFEEDAMCQAIAIGLRDCTVDSRVGRRA